MKLVQLECLIPRADLLFANLCKSACLAVAIFDILPANSGATRIRPDLMKSCGTGFSGIDFFLTNFCSEALVFTVASFGIAFRRVIPYGIHFDFNKAVIQPDSKALLDDIAGALKLSRVAA